MCDSEKGGGFSCRQTGQQAVREWVKEWQAMKGAQIVASKNKSRDERCCKIKYRKEIGHQLVYVGMTAVIWWNEL